MKKKKISFITIALCAVTLSANAQNWLLTGNSGTNPATNFVGTKDNNVLVFRTNNAERMRIGTNGNVGIGTTNPQQKLHVNGNINLAKGFSLFIENRRVLRVDSVAANIFLGNGTGRAITTGLANTATGNYALSSTTTGYSNTAYGASALRHSTAGSYNTAIGSDVMRNNSTGGNNTAIGNSALYFNLTGSNNVATGNSALNRNTSGTANAAHGYYALHLNIDGSANVANGSYSLYNNSGGDYNTATGAEALYSNNIASNNTATGYRALFSNTGDNNTATGKNALYHNTTGYNNTASGVHALFSNSTGGYNAAFGDYALQQTTGSWGNTAVGYRAGDAWNHGYNNTFIGSETDANTSDIYNSIALGHSAIVTAANQARIGNSYTSSIGGYTNWSNISDGRVKKNMKENVPGLAFINKLRPITYNLDLDAAEKIVPSPSVKDKDGKLLTQPPSQTEINARNAKQQMVYTGFVAQDVEKAAKELNYDFSGVDAAKSNKDLYALRYSDFVVPLVKAVQELSKMNEEKDEVINDLKTRIEKLEAMMNTKQSDVTSLQSSKMATISSASLEQNIPNPFNRTTTINYTLPQQFNAAKIIITDKSGRTLKQINVSGTGKNSLTVDASTLSSGTYQYSLYVDGRMISTKQMVRVR